MVVEMSERVCSNLLAALTQKVTEVESLTVPKIAAQVSAALERVEAMEKTVDSRIEDEIARMREEVESRAARVEKAMKDRDEAAEELAGKVQQLELERDRITALDEMVKKRLIPDPAIPKLQDELSRLNRRVDAVNEEGAATTKYIEEARGLANRAIERLARLEATPPGAVAKQEFAALEFRLVALEESHLKARKDLESQKEKIMVVLEDLETMREVAAPAPRR